MLSVHKVTYCVHSCGLCRVVTGAKEHNWEAGQGEMCMQPGQQMDRETFSPSSQ